MQLKENLPMPAMHLPSEGQGCHLIPLTLGSYLCGWCHSGSAQKSVQPHHPHREMRTRGWVPLLLMARCPHWKMQLYWEPGFPRGLRLPKEYRDFFPAWHGHGSPFK
ncbi:unnamed protein product [Staurois parvus]|uniref:Uncharacterized protein n=1 Tax=Staurois parvus TaxID=386267 RepID=A0ABN9DBP9_9NEOB|nr:unnamed protein product [Staurois parvus]